MLVSAAYALGTAQHETNYALNEVDTEVSGFVSSGIFQLSEEEKGEAGLPSADLLTLEGATDVLAAIAEQRLTRILVVHRPAVADPAARE